MSLRALYWDRAFECFRRFMRGELPWKEAAHLMRMYARAAVKTPRDLMVPCVEDARINTWPKDEVSA